MLFDTFIQGFTLFATITLAISGVLQAARSELDVFGALVLSCVCALGGGTLRDLLIDAPVFWVNDVSYLLTIIPTTLIAILLVRRIPTGRGIRLNLLDLADAAGLALFATLGTAKALQFNVLEPIAVVMGVITGIAGGMIRDILTQTPPTVLRGEIYASAAIIGAILYTLLRLFLPEVIAILGGMLSIFILRVMAIYWKLRLPNVKFPK